MTTSRYFNAPGKPRIIRSPIKWSNQKLPGGERRVKVARDKKSGFTAERIKARTDRICRCCGDFILSGTEYLKVGHRDWDRRLGHRYVPDPRDFHFACVPDAVKPLVRFFK